MMMTQPAINGIKVSVLIPAYNGDQYLVAAIESVLGQSYSNIELIIVDDGSTDNSVDIVQQYLSADSRIQLIQNDHNLGLVGNWNRCVELASGEWIKFLFQDDLLEPSCIERMVEAGKSTSCPFVVSRRDFIFEDVAQSTVDEYQKFVAHFSISAVMGSHEYLSPEMFCEAVLPLGVVNFIGEPSATLIGRNVFRRFGGFNASMIQLCDLEFWLRIGVTCGIAYIPETLVHVRMHGQSTTSSHISGRRFRKDVVDPLLLRAEFAFSKYCEPLRRVTTSVGRDLVVEFENELVGAQRWGEDSRSPEWEAVLSSYPQLGMPLGQRLRKVVRNALDTICGRILW